MGIADKLYSGSATFGRVTTVLFGGLTILIGLGALYMGYRAIDKRKDYTGKTTGTVSGVQECTNKKSNDCKLTVMYSVDGVQQTITVFSMTPRKVGDSVNIIYDPNKPSQGDLAENASSQRSNIYFVVGALLIIIPIITIILAMKYKGFAAFTGVMNFGGLLHH